VFSSEKSTWLRKLAPESSSITFASNETPPSIDRAPKICVLVFAGLAEAKLRVSYHDMLTVPSDWSTLIHGKNCVEAPPSSFTRTGEDQWLPPSVERMRYALRLAPLPVAAGKSQ
jgi:hypothetical protein